MHLRLNGAMLAALLGGFVLPVWGNPAQPPVVFGIPVDFILFALTLLGVALFHAQTLYVALSGLVAITAYKLLFTGFKFGDGLPGLASHLGHEWVALSNMYPEAKSVGNGLRHGWHAALAYVVGFAVLMLTLGWQPNEKHKGSVTPTSAFIAPAAGVPAAQR